ncbi:MAG: FkbM family methyltransferase [Terriglobia bacterium]
MKVRIDGPADWEIYNEVLVNGEYDRAIVHALAKNGGNECLILDLGANVGYFSFRCADLFFQAAGGRRLRIIAIEGSQRTFKELARRVASEPLLAGHVTVIHGLAGERVGSAHISDERSHFGNSLTSDKARAADEVRYVDLMTLLEPQGDIDLLKCDIEGSEFSLLRNYPDLLRRVRTAVFEFHKYGEDIDEYRRLLCSYGFVRHSVLRETPLFSVELFDRVSNAGSNQHSPEGTTLR